jgi:BirA family biotin operon repressor/biotin-[acetyl-CoA-carboxylase] ligase
LVGNIFTLYSSKLSNILAQKTAQWLNAPILYLDTIDSTNNYAMRLIDADKAQPGLTILAKAQTNGKGQRGKLWVDKPGESLLMSIVTEPQQGLGQQFIFSAVIANTIRKTLEELYKNWQITIKWPNDIIINAKKAGGILIENIIRGSKWSYAVIGFGLNVQQPGFPDDLPVATSLQIASGVLFETEQLMHILRHAIIEALTIADSAENIMSTYNKHLYQQGQWQLFEQDGKEVLFLLKEVHPNGSLEVTAQDGSAQYFNHGDITWKW